MPTTAISTATTSACILNRRHSSPLKTNKQTKKKPLTSSTGLKTLYYCIVSIYPKVLPKSKICTRFLSATKLGCVFR